MRRQSLQSAGGGGGCCVFFFKHLTPGFRVLNRHGTLAKHQHLSRTTCPSWKANKANRDTRGSRGEDSPLYRSLRSTKVTSATLSPHREADQAGEPLQRLDAAPDLLQRTRDVPLRGLENHRRAVVSAEQFGKVLLLSYEGCSSYFVFEVVFVAVVVVADLEFCDWTIMMCWRALVSHVDAVLAAVVDVLAKRTVRLRQTLSNPPG